MAFANKIGNLLKQAVSTKPSLYQAIRCMSSSRLFIGGLSYATDEQSLKEAFTSFGDIVEARVITDRETGRSRGFGFVSFTSAEEASAAISGMDGKDLQGRIVRVNYANERRGGFGGGGGYSGGGYGGGGYGGGGYNAGGGGGYSGGGYNTGGGGGYGGGGYNTGGGGYNNTGGYGGDGSSGGSYGGDGSSGGGYGGASTGGGYGGGGYNTGGGGYNNTGGYGGASTGGYGGSAGGGNYNMPSSDVHGSTPGNDGFTTGGYAGDLGGAGTVGYQSASNEQYSSSAENTENTNDYDTYKNQDSSLKGEERFDDEPENYANKQ